MKVKTHDLIGPALIWAVGACEGRRPLVCGSMVKSIWSNDGPDSDAEELLYTTDWAQGGPIIEREMTEIHREEDRWWVATNEHAETGPTLLIAAMRCFVGSKLGDEVDIPEGL
jgi:hypothetical protein